MGDTTLSSTSPKVATTQARPRRCQRGRCPDGGRVDVALLLVNANAISAVTFGLLQGAVRRAHESVLRAHVARRVEPDSDRDGDPVERGPADVVRLSAKR